MLAPRQNALLDACGRRYQVCDQRLPKQNQPPRSHAWGKFDGIPVNLVFFLPFLSFFDDCIIRMLLLFSSAFCFFLLEHRYFFTFGAGVDFLLISCSQL
jgi:hypothetical protein